MVEDEIRPEEAESQEPATPVCLRCMQPVDPVAYYCPNCGEATGQLTPYIPFVNIPWQTQIWGRMWRQLWSHDISIAGRLLRLLMIVWGAHVLLLGLFFRPRSDGRDSTREESEPPQDAL